MPASVIDLYDQLTNAPDDRARARILAQAFEALESRYPHISELATRTHLSETELKLTKEIEQVRAELKETELKLTKEIEQVRAELTKEIEKVRLEIAKVRADLGRDIERTRSSILLWSFGFWITQLVVMLTLVWRLWPATVS
ncbi:MAG: hypothetical protein ACUVT2_10130 [Thiobacillaceae bacterium]